MKVLDGEIDVGKSIERDDAVLACGKRCVRTFFCHYQCVLVVLLRCIENSHAAVVGADVVQRLHPFKRVAHVFGKLQSFAVFLQSLVETAFVAQLLAPLAQYDYLPEQILLLAHCLMNTVKPVHTVQRLHDAVYLMSLFSRERDFVLSTARCKHKNHRCQCTQIKSPCFSHP